MSLASDIASLMNEYGYYWKINGHLKVPTRDDIHDTLDRAVEVLYDKEPNDQLEVGRLIIKKRDNEIYDVFMLVGTIGEDDGS